VGVLACVELPVVRVQRAVLLRRALRDPHHLHTPHEPFHSHAHTPQSPFIHMNSNTLYTCALCDPTTCTQTRVRSSTLETATKSLSADRVLCLVQTVYTVDRQSRYWTYLR
jgi:hypothetical protein